MNKSSVLFDTAEFMKTNFPELHDSEDDRDWFDWAEACGYRESACADLIRASNIRDSLRARALVLRTIPKYYFPFSWRDESSSYINLNPHYKFGSGMPESLLKLQYELICSFMELIPSTLEFEQSNDPLVPELYALNLTLLGTMSRIGKLEEVPAWYNHARPIACYRLRLPELPSGRQTHSGAYGAYRFLQSFEGINEEAQETASLRMQQLIERELSGDPECTGALEEYVTLVIEWVEWPDEAACPFSTTVVQNMMRFLVNLDMCLWERRVPVETLGGYGVISQLSREQPIVEKLGWHFLIDQPLSDEYPNARHALAQAVLKVGCPEQLMSVARSIAETDEKTLRDEEEADKHRIQQLTLTSEARRAQEEARARILVARLGDKKREH